MDIETKGRMTSWDVEQLVLAALREKLGRDPTEQEWRKSIAQWCAELHWVKSQEIRTTTRLVSINTPAT